MDEIEETSSHAQKEDTEEVDLAKKTFDLLRQLSKRVQNLEAVRTTGPSSSKRPQDHADSDVESGGEEEPREKKSRIFAISSPMKKFLQSAFCLPKQDVLLFQSLEFPRAMKPVVQRWTVSSKGCFKKKHWTRTRNCPVFKTSLWMPQAPWHMPWKSSPRRRSPVVTHAVTMAIQEALVLLGNASCHMSVERRSKELTKLIPDLKSMAEEEDFSKVQPFLFGSGFVQKTKEHTEALKCLRKVTTKQTSGHPNKFFRGNRPHQSGGSGGRNSYCQNNYQSSYQYKPNNSFRRQGQQRGGTEGNKPQ